MSTVIIIVGPTAVGKTSLSIELAKHFNTQIVSADSRQCYRELNIGVAKPSDEELKEVHHYFINSHSIHEDVNAGVYEQYALQSVDEIFKHNKIAVMVGGTGLYVKAFCEGMDVMPAIPDEVRRQIITQYNTNGLVWLQEQVQIKDPGFWATAEQQNPQRLMRALEMVEATGISITTFRQKKKIERPFNIIKIGLELPKPLLYHNINTRVDIMMEQGLLKEAEALIPVRELNALQTVGYRELFDYFDDKCTLEKAVEQIKINTRHYAKRQMTWFKRDEDIKWFDAKESSVEEILKGLGLKV
ncbi:tRNA (adenosine(37)-N6)-dimethylallyltransferase MiaA [Chitinophagaceae bacterium LWZ2-11]